MPTKLTTFVPLACPPKWPSAIPLIGRRKEASFSDDSLSDSNFRKQGGTMIARKLWLLTATAALLACNAFDEEASDADSKLVIPTDTRAAVQALETPPPISGGTLAIDPTGSFAVAADPDRDRVSIVDLNTHGVRHVELDAGDEPGRVAVDSAGRAHVALRRAGSVVSIDLQSAEELSRRTACAAPRGVAYDEIEDSLFVACSEGMLVQLPAGGGDAINRVHIADDLRDVVPRGDNLIVTRFKSAEAMVVNRDGQVLKTMRPPMQESFRNRFQPDGRHLDEFVMLEPHVAWRTTVASNGDVMMLHQNSSREKVEIEATHDTDGGGDGFSEAQSSPYGGSSGGGFNCEGIVQTSMSVMSDAQGLHDSRTFGGMVLTVDMAITPGGQRVAMVQAGAQDPDAPQPFTVFRNDDFGQELIGPMAAGSGNVVIFERFPNDFLATEGEDVVPQLCEFGTSMHVEGQPTAVAFRDNGALVVQSREPATLSIFDSVPFGERIDVDLGGDSVADTGHDIFHRNAGAGIACAGCHAEGGDDGHTWDFVDLGRRRTQSVHVGLEGTAPFHWDGDMHDLPMLMEEVFVGRMGGVRQSRERLEAMAEWMFALQPPPPALEADDPSAMRGKELFESADVGCASCHNGDKLTDNKSYHVGTTATDHALQVPSLVGVGYRTPLIHTGCAETLADRFDPDCGGGDLHGTTSHLSEGEIDDLVSYLRTL